VRSSAEDVDRHVGLRIGRRLTMLGLTQKRLAQLLGVTSQQAQKYETGLNRLVTGRLH
jgi:transcriptional regulator with XRE-family HTH domain